MIIGQGFPPYLILFNLLQTDKVTNYDYYFYTKEETEAHKV